MSQQILESCSWTEAELQPLGRGAPADRHHANSNDGGDERQARLIRTIETEVIPRLMMAVGKALEPASPPPYVGDVTEAEIDAFARIVLTPDLKAATDFMDRVRTRGMTVELICIELLAPAARRLGEFWEDDTCSFVDVTVGLGRLQHLLHSLNPNVSGNGIRSVAIRSDDARRALLMPGPGEQHTFGLLIVAEFFLRGGWDVWGGPLAKGCDPVEMVRAEWFDVIGLSASCDSQIDGLTRLVGTLRRASRNPAVGVLVGGRPFINNPALAAQVGADGTAIDGRQAAILADSLVARLSVQR